MDRILLFDSLNLFIRNFAVLNFSNEDGDHVGGTVGVLQSTKSMIELFHPTKVVFCWDGKNSGQKRRNLLPEYKEGRKVRKSLNRTFQWESPEAEKVAFRRELFRVKEYLETMPFYQVELDQMEADDAIAYISKNYWTDSEKVIVSSDKDYFQLVTDKINVYRPVKKELITYDKMMNELKVHPSNWILVKILSGDKTDSVPPITRGIGIATAIKMFPFVSETTQHSVTDIIQLCEANKEKGKLYQGVLDNKDKLDVFWKVMQLEDVQLSVDGITTIKESLGQKPTFKPFQLRLLFLQDNAFKQINQFQFWNRILMPLNQASNLVETTEEKGE